MKAFTNKKLGVLAITFVIIQFWRGDKATLPPRIISQRSIVAACTVSFGFGSAFMILAYYLPIWFQAIQDVSATQSGIRNLPLILGISLFTIVGGVITTITGYYNYNVIGGAILGAIGMGITTTLEVDSNAGKWIGMFTLVFSWLLLLTYSPRIPSTCRYRCRTRSSGPHGCCSNRSFGC